MNFGNLMSGFLGALIGGVLSYLGAMRATNKTISSLDQQDRKRRRFDREKEGRAMLEAIIAESKQNLILSKKIKTGNSMTPFSNETWSLFKGSIDYLDSPLQQKVLELYIEISRYNGLIDYDKATTSHGQGYNNQDIVKQGTLIAGLLEPLIYDLEGSFRAFDEKESEGLTFQKPM